MPEIENRLMVIVLTTGEELVFEYDTWYRNNGFHVYCREEDGVDIAENVNEKYILYTKQLEMTKQEYLRSKNEKVDNR